MSTGSYQSIVMNFQKARAQADQLEQLSKRMETIANDRFGGVMRSVNTNWKGDNAAAYIKKCEILRQKLLQSSGNLSRAARTIRTIARNTYNAEMRAWRIARQKNY